MYDMVFYSITSLFSKSLSSIFNQNLYATDYYVSKYLLIFNIQKMQR